ncbi:hypothetical protein JCM10213v2_001250 [Rhodosporidiobolus nylandii]
MSHDRSSDSLASIPPTADSQNDPPRSVSAPLPPPRRRARCDTPAPLRELDGGESATTTRTNSPEPLATPTLAESYGQLKKNLSFASLRELEIKELSTHIYRQGSRADRRKYAPKDDDEVFTHALRGGIRSFILGSTLRALVNLAIALLRLKKKKGLPPAVIIRALFVLDTFRFGGMLGIFSFLYKWTLHTLRLYNFGPQGPGRDERWHAALAGAVSGLAVWAEKPSRRTTIGQQLFVRGLQGHYMTLKSAGKINLKNVSVLVFGFSCAQIMYSWLMVPEALPPSYASHVSAPCIPVNRSTYRSGTFDPALARATADWGRGATVQNRSLIEAYAARGEKGDFGPPFAPCETVHPWAESCTWNGIDRWAAVFRWISPVYAGLHFIPPIVLRRKAFLNEYRHIFEAIQGKVPEWLVKLLLHKSYYWFSGFATCLALFIEEKKRRRELAMYVLPRGLESLWSILRRRSYVPFVPGGEIMLTSCGLAMVMQTYQHNPEHLSGLVRSLLYQFVGHG